MEEATPWPQQAAGGKIKIGSTASFLRCKDGPAR
jgi:hypothetical protein